VFDLNAHQSNVLATPNKQSDLNFSAQDKNMENYFEVYKLGEKFPGSYVIFGILPNSSNKELIEFSDYVRTQCPSCIVVLFSNQRGKIQPKNIS